MTHRARHGLAALLFLLLAAPAPAQVTLKMATLWPENSSFFQILKNMGADWTRLSGGKVKLILYPGARQGDEPDVVRKMRLGTLQGALLASPGLAEIDRAVYALSIPMAFDNYDEVYATLDKLRPELEAGLAAKGFIALNWADTGWARIFSRKPAPGPDDLRRQKLFQWAGDTPTLELWKAAGFNAIPAPGTELATGLQTGLLDAFLGSPQVVLITRYYETAGYMTDLRWAVVLAGTVVTRAAWEKIPADLRPALLKSAQEAGARYRADIRASDERDLAAMEKAGLKVVAVDARNREAWHKAVAAASGKIRGAFTPAASYDAALRYRDEYRRANRNHK